MSERNNILGRIREALKLRAPAPGEAGHAHDAGHGHAPFVPRPASTHARQWLPAVPEDREARMALFATNSADLKTEFLRVPDVAALVKALVALGRESGWKTVASHQNDLTAAACQGLGLPVLWVDSGYAPEALETCDAGITACDALVAQTGSLLITARSAGGRALSVLPPHHVVVARQSQLVPDLTAAFERLQATYGSNYPSFISLVTGPSRTGDIERILVLGAHGPKRLTILVIDEAP